MAVSRAVRLRECPLVELTLYLKEAIRNWLLHILSIPIQTVPCSVRLFTVSYFPVKSYRSTVLTVTGGHYVIGFKYTEGGGGGGRIAMGKGAPPSKPSPPQSTVQSDYFVIKNKQQIIILQLTFLAVTSWSEKVLNKDNNSCSFNLPSSSQKYCASCLVSSLISLIPSSSSLVFFTAV